MNIPVCLNLSTSPSFSSARCTNLSGDTASTPALKIASASLHRHQKWCAVRMVQVSGLVGACVSGRSGGSAPSSIIWSKYLPPKQWHMEMQVTTHIARRVTWAAAHLRSADESMDIVTLYDASSVGVRIFDGPRECNARSKPRKWGYLPQNLFDSFAG